ncbi:MAG: transposase zinc-binding domain-containing protein [Myxococcales bacterium]|nr:transposase zinc-binding domain-containing protein [Myxococcales bacterium]
MGHPAHTRPEPSRVRHRPESTLLYQTVAEHWPAFLERADEHGGLPRFVVKEFEAYLRCGQLEHGCLHLVCRDCGYSSSSRSVARSAGSVHPVWAAGWLTPRCTWSRRCCRACPSVIGSALCPGVYARCSGTTASSAPRW